MKSEILPGVSHTFMTFNGQIPGPMIRARQGDTLRITVTNPAENVESHSIDLHAVYGTGGGGAFTEVAAGESKSFTFKLYMPVHLFTIVASPTWTSTSAVVCSV